MLNRNNQVPAISFPLSAIKYTTGIRIRERNKELDNPPINTQARPFIQTEPGPVANAIGSMAIIIENVVIKIGRNRTLVAWSKASAVESPSFLI